MEYITSWHGVGDSRGWPAALPVRHVGPQGSSVCLGQEPLVLLLTYGDVMASSNEVTNILVTVGNMPK